MKDYAGPCYSIPEALELLGLRRSELVHAVSQQEIELVAYTQPRKMLLFRTNQAKEWIGMATCNYRGHISLHLNFFLSMLEEKKIHVATGWGRLLDQSGVSGWRSDYPFRRELPHGFITNWQGKVHNEHLVSYYCATPFPNEYEPMLDIISKSLDKALAARAMERPAGFETKPASLQGLQLNFHEHSIFEPSSLRIPASEIERYLGTKKQKAAEKSALEAIKAEQALKPGERENQLHTLIGRMIQKYPDIGAKQAWSYLKHDTNTDRKVFDTDEILLLVDEEGLEWQSKYGEQQALKYTSFAATLSKIKRRLA